jgi:hypothetical protein
MQLQELNNVRLPVIDVVGRELSHPVFVVDGGCMHSLLGDEVFTKSVDRLADFSERDAKRKCVFVRLIR